MEGDIKQVEKKMQDLKQETRNALEKIGKSLKKQ
jgi:hypothetical protein